MSHRGPCGTASRNWDRPARNSPLGLWRGRCSTSPATRHRTLRSLCAGSFRWFRGEQFANDNVNPFVAQIQTGLRVSSGSNRRRAGPGGVSSMPCNVSACSDDPGPSVAGRELLRTARKGNSRMPRLHGQGWNSQRWVNEPGNGGVVTGTRYSHEASSHHPASRRRRKGASHRAT